MNMFHQPEFAMSMVDGFLRATLALAEDGDGMPLLARFTEGDVDEESRRMVECQCGTFVTQHGRFVGQGCDAAALGEAFATARNKYIGEGRWSRAIPGTSDQLASVINQNAVGYGFVHASELPNGRVGIVAS